MEVEYLIDTNVFLEILLNQEKKEECKIYLTNKFGNISISDFSLHSIGVILFRHKKFTIYNSFIEDVLPKIKVEALSKTNYNKVEKIAMQYNLDFDDAYQVAVAESNNLIISTMDKDFNKVVHKHKIDFI
jgi:predicted nucleic acid-binding protein